MRVRKIEAVEKGLKLLILKSNAVHIGAIKKNIWLISQLFNEKLCYDFKPEIFFMKTI